MAFRDPMKDIPELAGLDPAEAERLRKEVHFQILRQPAVLAGLIATLALAVYLVGNFRFLTGLLDILWIMLSLCLVGFAYRVLVVNPRVRARLREMGYPKTD